jgi:dTMP kinase
MTRHYWIVLEGGDGAGKTSIRRHLFGTVRAAGHEVLTLIQTSWLVPEYTKVITNARFHHKPCPPEQITAAYVGDKEAMTERLIVPHLADRHLLGDRFVLSDMVYHRILWDIPEEVTYAAYAGSRVRFPDLTIFVNTPPEVAVHRMAARRAARRRWDALETQQRIHAAYTRIVSAADRFPVLGAIRVVDNSGSPQETMAQVNEIALPLLIAPEEPRSPAGELCEPELYHPELYEPGTRR